MQNWCGMGSSFFNIDPKKCIDVRLRCDHQHTKQMVYISAMLCRLDVGFFATPRRFIEHSSKLEKPVSRNSYMRVSIYVSMDGAVSRQIALVRSGAGGQTS